MIEVERTRWGAIIILVTIGIITVAQFYKLAAALPLLRIELGLGLVAGGWLFSIVNATTATVGFAMGSFADQIGHRRAVLGALLIVVVAGFWQSFVNSFGALLALRFIEGTAALLATVTLPAIIVRCARSVDRDAALALWGAYFPVGAGVTFIVAPLLLEYTGWRTLWQITALMSLLTFVVMTLTPTPPDPPRSHSSTGFFKRLRVLLASPASWLLMLSFFCFNMMMGPLLAWLPTYLIEVRGIAPSTAGVVTALVIVVNVIGVFAAGWILRRGVQVWQVFAITGVILMILSFGIFLSQMPDWVRLGSAILFSALGGLLPGAAFAAVPRMAPGPEYLAGMGGMMIQGAQMGHFIAPPIMAWVVVRAGGDWSAGLWQFLASSVLIVMLALLVRRLPLASNA